MEAVKYNKAIVTQVFHAILWPDRHPIFRDSINKLFSMRQDAKSSGNKSPAEVAKLLMVSSYGKSGKEFTTIKFYNSEIDKY